MRVNAIANWFRLQKHSLEPREAAPNRAKEYNFGLNSEPAQRAGHTPKPAVHYCHARAFAAVQLGGRFGEALGE